MQGEIDPALSDLLDGMSSTINSIAEKGRVKTLIGHLVDQAALSGVLKFAL